MVLIPGNLGGLGSSVNSPPGSSNHSPTIQYIWSPVIWRRICRIKICHHANKNLNVWAHVVRKLSLPAFHTLLKCVRLLAFFTVTIISMCLMEQEAWFIRKAKCLSVRDVQCWLIPANYSLLSPCTIITINTVPYLIQRHICYNVFWTLILVTFTIVVWFIGNVIHC